MPISVTANAVVAKPGQTVSLASLFSVTASSSNPTFLILSGLDRDEYTAGYTTSGMGTLAGSGAVQHFQNPEGDAWSVSAVFTYQPTSGQYFNPTYGYFSQLTFAASAETNDNVNLSLYTTGNAALANADATDPYALIENPGSFAYAGSVSVVTQPGAAMPPPQATPNSISAAALSFVGHAWNIIGCWVLASNIAAEGGCSLPPTTSLVGIAGVGNGEWTVAYNGPVSANSNWLSQVTAGEMVVFQTASGGGHIATIVSGSGSSALMVDNVAYVNGSGAISNPANDGSPNDIAIAAPHSALQEFSGINAGNVVIYRLDTPTVQDAVTSLTLAPGTSRTLATLFGATNAIASQPITQWQAYDTNSTDTITLGGVAATAAHTAASAATGALANLALHAGNVACLDTIEARAFNGSYWSDWQSLSVMVIGSAAAAPPRMTDQTPAQSWQSGGTIALTLPANTFTDPNGQALHYAATQANGQPLPAWLGFNGATDAFSGTAPVTPQSLSLKVAATDTSGLTASETFSATVQAPPAAAPKITVSATPDQSWAPGHPTEFVLPSSTFTDALGLNMSLAAFEVAGPNVTSWLHFNPASGLFSGNVPAMMAGTVELAVLATDARHAVAIDEFNVHFTGAATHGFLGDIAGIGVAAQSFSFVPLPPS
jgi:hypothetical protein